MRSFRNQNVSHKYSRTLAAACGVLVLFAGTGICSAQKTVNLNAADLVPHTEIFFSPPNASFLQGSTFEVSVFLNTEGNSVNAIELHIAFDPNKLSIIRPSGGTSIIGAWAEPPSYDNTKGTVKIVGTIPGGIKSDSALITTLLFKANISGDTSLTIPDTSQVLLNDGAGTPTQLNTSPGRYSIVPKPPEGPQLSSETHPFQDRWYNNNSPSFSWVKDPGVTGFSIAFDDTPTTIPDNTVNATDTIQAYQNIADGVWYFHVKALKQGVWGSTSTYTVHIDTTPPAAFTPTVDYLSAAAVARFLVSFFTTDALSGIDHYEVGVIDRSTPTTESPVFVQTESPYQLPFNATQQARIIVRAFDRAGNIREAGVDANVPFLPLKAVTDNAVVLLLGILVIIIMFFVTHYIVNHRLITRIEKGFELLKKEEMREKNTVPSDAQGAEEHRI